MSYTIEQRDALRQAIASGVLKVAYDHKQIEYRTMVELITALNEVEAGLARECGKTQTRRILINAHKDL